jgi:hypothetical protein
MFCFKINTILLFSGDFRSFGISKRDVLMRSKSRAYKPHNHPVSSKRDSLSLDGASESPGICSISNEGRISSLISLFDFSRCSRRISRSNSEDAHRGSISDRFARRILRVRARNEARAGRNRGRNIDDETRRTLPIEQISGHSAQGKKEGARTQERGESRLGDPELASVE